MSQKRRQLQSLARSRTAHHAPPPRPRALWILAALLPAAAFAAYIPSLSNGFMNWDDGQYIQQNENLAPLSWHTVAWAFTSTQYAANWHPLTWLSHALDFRLYGQSPAGHHLTNLLLHAANSLLVLLVLHRLTRRL